MAEQTKTQQPEEPPGTVPMGLESFERSFEYFAPRLRAYFVRRGAGATSEELVQEVMFTVWTKRDRFDPTRGSLSGWVFTIARNKHLDNIRRAYPEADPHDPLWVSRNPASAAAPDEQAATQQRTARLRRALMGLPSELRVLLVALYQDGKSMSELATETDTPLGTIKTRARRALTLLREQVTEAER